MRTDWRDTHPFAVVFNDERAIGIHASSLRGALEEIKRNFNHKRGTFRIYTMHLLVPVYKGEQP